MEVFSIAASQMMIMFALMAVGIFARKAKFTNDKIDGKLSFFVLDICMPCMIVASVLGSTSLPSNDTILQILFWGTLSLLFVVGIAMVAGRFITKVLKTSAKTRGTLEFLMAFSNIRVIGFPMLGALFGPEAVVYGAIFNIPATFFTWSAGVIMLSSRDEAVQGVSTLARVKDMGKALLNPCMVACLIAVALVLLNVTDSGAVGTSLGLLGQLTMPGAMFVIGSSIAKIPLKQLFKVPRTFLSSLVRLVVVPVATYFVFGFFITDPLLLGVITLLMAMPVASFGTMMCVNYGGDETAMTSGTFLTTMLSMGTIPTLAMMIV